MTLGVLSLLLAVFGAPWNPAQDFRSAPDARMPSAAAVRFSAAVPVWPEGRANETNSFFGFRADFTVPSGGRPILKITSANVYRVFVDGRFVGHGPVRAPHGYARTDEWPLDAFVRSGVQALAVEVANYNEMTFDGVGPQPGFLQCEVSSGDEVLCATGRDFTFVDLPRVRNTARMTSQRARAEMYRLSPGWDAWRTEVGWKGGIPARTSGAKLLPRVTPYPPFDIVRPRAFAATDFAFDDRTPPRHPELAYDGEDELSRLSDARTTETTDAAGAVAFGKGFMADFGRVDAGFLGFEVECAAPCKLYVVWDEILTDGIPDPLRHWAHPMSSVWEFTAPGTYRVEMAEPTCLRYLHAFARQGTAKVGGFYLREFKNPRVYAATFECSDARLNRVFAAARDTCAQCTMDATLDNPDRERNSGPCDAFFTLGGYALLSGDHSVERLMFENYAIPDSYPWTEGDMLPWCYPADFTSSRQAIIPQYVAWLVIQLERYTADSGDTSIRDRMRGRLLKLPAVWRRFRNAEGFTEGMPWWGFLGWSMVSAFTKDVSYPSDAVWAEALDALDRLYGRPELGAEAAELRGRIRARSFDGTWFRDHARRGTDGKLVTCDDLSETCQYYMLRFGVASPAADADYWNRVVSSLGRYAPGYGKALGRMYPANYFQGLMLRHALLADAGRCREAVRELGFLVDMADVTGTLWESYPGICDNFSRTGTYSCCQGFTSYAAALIARAALGLGRIDRVNRTVAFAVPDNGLRFCRGSLPTADGPISAEWTRKDGKVEEKLTLPKGWRCIGM